MRRHRCCGRVDRWRERQRSANYAHILKLSATGRAAAEGKPVEEPLEGRKLIKEGKWTPRATD